MQGPVPPLIAQACWGWLFPEAEAGPPVQLRVFSSIPLGGTPTPWLLQRTKGERLADKWGVALAPRAVPVYIYVRAGWRWDRGCARCVWAPMNHVSPPGASLASRRGTDSQRYSHCHTYIHTATHMHLLRHVHTHAHEHTHRHPHTH